jgi:GTP-binding protein
MKEKTSSASLTLTDTIFTPNQLVLPEVPQVALAGRSNVGKSTLVNCLAGHKGLAKTSSTPGKTRSLNFYRVDPDGFFLVDLPGYGYARCSKTEREKWAKLIDAYIRDNPWLRAVVSIVDCRLTPQKLDLELQAYLRGLRIPIILVLTKIDKCKQAEREKRRKDWRDMGVSSFPPALFSGKTALGRDALMQLLARAALDGPASTASSDGAALADMSEALFPDQAPD